MANSTPATFVVTAHPGRGVGQCRGYPQYLHAMNAEKRGRKSCEYRFCEPGRFHPSSSPFLPGTFYFLRAYRLRGGQYPYLLPPHL
ncbi:hypothetical protein C7212DRAFT_20616, partial [Tuber magnatum]